MRIAMVTQSYPPMISGASIFVKQLSDSLSKRDHSVLVLAASETSYASQINEANLKVVKVKSLHNPLRVNQRFALWPQMEMMKQLNAFAPDIIHIHDPLAVGLISLAYRRKTGTPLVMTVHALPWFVTSYLKLPKRVKTLIETIIWNYSKFLYSHLDGVVVATETTAKIIREHSGIDPVIISCGVDLETFCPSTLPSPIEDSPRERFGIPRNAPIILHVGRLDKDKKVNKILEGAKSVLLNTEAHLLIVGDGTEMQNLKSLSKKLGIRNKVHFFGYLSKENDLINFYRIASIFVTASEIETQGIVLLEAAACGLPIVAPNSTSIPEIVHDQVNGYLFPPGDTKTMAESILKILNNKKMATSMGKASTEIVKQHDFTKTIDQYESLYKSCVETSTKKQLSTS